MSEHTQLKHKPANASGASFLSSGGDMAFAPPTSTSLSRESSTAPQTTPDRPSSVQETTPDQETSDLQAQLESQYSLAYDFGSMAIARQTGPSVANSAEEPPRSNGTHPTIQRRGVSSVAVHAPVQGHDFSRISIQPKLTIGQPNDSYEQEADRVAEQVMRMPEPGNSGSAASAGFTGHDFSQVALQPGLQPSTEVENQTPIAVQQRLTEGNQVERRPIQPLAATITPFVQREVLPEPEETKEPEAEAEVDSSEMISTEEEKAAAKEEEFIQTKPVQRQANQSQIETDHKLEQQLDQSRGAGSSLPDETRTFMESRFGADFSAVRVHTDASAMQMNRKLQAQAFTYGNDIYFGAGQTPGKNDLTAHELTHTIQQTGGLQTKSAPESKHEALSQRSPSNSSNSPLIGQVQRFSSSRHNWQVRATIPTQLQQRLNPISTSSVFSIQRKAALSGEDPNGTVAAQVQSASTSQITAPSAGGERRSPSTGSSGAGFSTEDNPYRSVPTPVQNGNKQTSAPTQDNASTIKAESSGNISRDIGSNGAKVSPKDDPDFQVVAAKGQRAAQEQQQHDPAELESREAQDAAQSPAQEVTSQAQDRQVDEMAQQQPGEFDPQAFKDAIFEKLEEITPKNQEDAENFDQDNDLDSVRQEVSSDVGEERDQAAAPIEEETQEAPDPSGIEPRRETPMQPPARGTAPGAIGAEQATPKPKSDAEVSQPLEANQQEIDQQMSEADITEEQLANANEPEFDAALDAKQEVKADAEKAPDAYRQQEQVTLNQAQTDAQATAATQLEGMHAQRQDSLTQVEGLQGNTKSTDEQKRTEIADHINGIYDRVKQEVETTLSTLETDVTSKFDRAANTARHEFEDYVKREKRNFLFDRYVTGATEPGKNLAENLGASEPVANVVGVVSAPLVSQARMVDDALTGLPPEVEEIFAEGRRRYLDDMSVALDEIANTVADRLNEAMQKIEDGKQEIQQYVTNLPANLRQIGQEAASNIESKFDQLEQQVRDKHDELVNTLAQKYQERLDEIDSRIEELKAQNRGLVDRAMDTIDGVINTIRDIKAMLERLFAGAREVIDKIIKDPIGFLSNLIEGLKQGFNNFVGNIGKHLQSGLIGWLTGTMGKIGIEIPDDIFSLKGIFSLTTQILGLTWDYMRTKAVKMFGEPTVTAMEEGAELFMVLKNDGPAGLWEHVKDQFTDLKETVIGEIQNILITEVIEAGVKWVLGLLTPASAFVKAAMMIYDIIMFFVDRGQQIMALVESIISSIRAIANGDTREMAVSVEDTLSRSLPVVIGFLASLLGIGGLAKRVQNIFEAIQKRIDDAIEWVLEKAKKLFKKLVKKGRNAVEKVVQWWKNKKQFKTKDGETHTLFFKGADRDSVLMVASNPRPYTSFLEWVETNEELDEEKRTALRQAKEIAEKIEIETARQPESGLSEQQLQAAREEKDTNIKNFLEQLREHTAILFGTNLPEWQKPELPPVNSEGFGQWMKAEVLTRVEVGQGSEPTSAQHTQYDKLNKRRNKTGSNYYVRGHLLNQKLGGEGIWTNMTPLSRSGNIGHEEQFESLVKAGVESGAILKYHVTPVYQERSDKVPLKNDVDKVHPNNSDEIKEIIDAEDHVPHALTCEVQRLEQTDNDQLKEVGTPRAWSVINPIERTAESYFLNGSSKPKPVVINTATESELEKIPGITPAQAKKIRETVENRDKPFGTYETLSKETGIGLVQLQKWNQDGFIVLR